MVERHAAADTPVYGINTGFGSLSEVKIPRSALGDLQRNLLRSHAAGVGEPLPPRAVRAMMALRANVLAKGYSGIRRATLDRLIDALNARVHPVVPSRGSVGAIGDLAPLAHLSLVLIGEGTATIGDDPAALDGGTALAGAGLAPVTLEAKEGLALINGTQASTAVAALALLGASGARAQECDFSPRTQFITNLVATTPQVPGAGLRLARGEQVLYEHYFGSYTAATVVPIASATKVLSAATVMTLVDDAGSRCTSAGAWPKWRADSSGTRFSPNASPDRSA